MKNLLVSHSPLKLLISAYFKHLPLLLLAGFFYFLVWQILTHVYPSAIRNYLLPGSYFPLLMLLFAGHFCFFSYLMVNTRRGVLMALALSAILWLQLQRMLDPTLFLGTLLYFLMLEICLRLSESSPSHSSPSHSPKSKITRGSIMSHPTRS